MTVTAICSVLRAPRACELRRKLAGRAAIALIFGLLLTRADIAQAQDHAPAADQHATADHAAAEGDHSEGEHASGLSALLWPTANFIVLVVVLTKFLRAPLAEYLAGRSAQIRKDLVEASELNAAATAQLAEVDRKLKALPSELEALRTRGAQEIAAEEERIANAAAADRTRLLTQTRREIEVRLQQAQRELSNHASALALQLAQQKLEQELTPADHARLVDRYVDQVKER